MAKVDDSDLIERMLREAQRIHDGTIVKILKASLEMQARILKRLEKLEEQVSKRPAA